MSASKIVKVSSKQIKAKRGRKPAEATGTAASAQPKRGSKTAFILSFPMDTPSRQIVDEGAQKGLKFSQTYVSAIRTAKRKKDGTTGPKAKPGRKPKALGGLTAPARPVATTGKSTPEDRLISAILDVGIGRARQVLAYVVDQLERMSYPS